MLIAPINAAELAERSRFQRALLDTYPNISVIGVAEYLARERILNNVTLASLSGWLRTTVRRADSIG